ncbi:MAG: MFS transporter [Deltaproteobacteria bacterium]|nr:MFS transporter [Deltaproteobacteria bacterium]
MGERNSGLRAIGRDRLVLLGYVTGGHFAVHWFGQLFPLILEPLKVALRLSYVQVGALTTMRELTTGLVNLPAGLLGDRLARHRTAILSSALLAMGLAYFIFGMASTYLYALVAAGLVGAGIALWHPTAMASLSSRFPEHRATAFAVHGMGATVGDTLTPVVVGLLFVLYPWRPIMALQLVLAVLVGIPLWLGLRGVFRTQAAASGGGGGQAAAVGEFLRNPAFLGMALANGLMNTGRVLVMTFFPLYVIETLGYSYTGVGTYYALLHVMGTVSQPFLGYLSDRLGRKWVLVPAFLMLAVLYTLVPLVDAGIPLGIVVTLIGLFFYTLTNVTAAAIVDVAGSRIQATSLGITFLSNSLFTLPGPVIGGYLVEHYGMGSVFYLCGALLLAAAAVITPLKLYRGWGR